nr:hypothetical protein [Tanacetum cinerariifolium]
MNGVREFVIKVGAKSRNISYLKGKVPSLVGFLLQMIVAIRVQELKNKVPSSGMPWPEDEGNNHTINPTSGDSLEIYADVVKGLGETLVGAYPGRALSFISKKDKLDSPKVLSYPSKPIGLFIRRSIIFRSDSNSEDLEGYAGAGLYD